MAELNVCLSDYGMYKLASQLKKSFFCLLVFQWPFDFNSEWYAILFPKFLYPLNNIIFNCSIFLTIVIAYERWFLNIYDEFFLSYLYFRFNAVCRPHAYRASAAGGISVGRRVASHVLPVILFSTGLNIPKFWETELVSF